MKIRRHRGAIRDKGPARVHQVRDIVMEAHAEEAALEVATIRLGTCSESKTI